MRRSWQSKMMIFYNEIGGSMLMEYVIMCMLILSGGVLAFSEGGNFLCQMVGIKPDAASASDFGIAGAYFVNWVRRLMWMTAQPFP